VLDGGADERLKEILYEVCEEKNAELLELEVIPDHVHVLINVDPQYGIHRLVKAFKGRSSRLLRDQFPRLRRRPGVQASADLMDEQLLCCHCRRRTARHR